MNKPVRLAPPEQADFRARFTTAEFMRMAKLGAFDDMKIELVHGELQRINPPMSMHSFLQTAVVTKLAGVAKPPLQALAEVGFDLGNDTIRGCDAALVRELPADNRLLTAADVLLVVEVAETTLERDLGGKKADYAMAGIPTYWVIDRAAQVIHVFGRPEAGTYLDEAKVRFGEPLAVPGVDATITLD